MTPAPSSPQEAPAKQVLWRYAVGVVAALLLPFVFWPSLLTKATSSNFLAHRFCFFNNPELVWANVVSDSVIALSYIAISATLALLVQRARRDIPFSWVFLAFGLFIVACGGTHLMEALTVWVPLYWLSADVKIVTALASLATAISLPRLVPKTISLLAASKVAAERKLQLEEANTRLLGRTQDATSRLAAIVEGSEDAIIAFRLDGVVTDWNQAATRLYGYSAEEAIGHNLSVIVPPSRAHELTEILNVLAAGGRIRQFETVRLRNDGSPVDVSFSVAPITGQNGTVIGVAGITHDITDRKRMEEALRRSEERFRLAALATKDAIWDLDVSSGGVWRSETFWEHFGYPPKDKEPDVTGWKDLVHPEDRDRVWNQQQTALSRRSDSYEVEYRFRRADDSYAVVLDRAYIVYDEHGQPLRAVGAITDLSDRRELEEQFLQAQKMEAVGRLAGGVAHDFNNILMIIRSYSDMMREQLNPEDKHRKNVDQVLKAAERAASLTQQLLAFSRKQRLSPRIIDLNFVVEDSSKMIKRLIGEDIELNVSLGKPLWAVKADPGQIVQVLMNLCVNARDAMRKGGELGIGTENVSIDVEAARKRPAFVPGNYAVLVVSDTGTGMTKEVQTHLFDPFFTTKESGKGTGLGLSTVYGIVKQSGGYIWFESELGRGSSFSLYFPAVDAPLTTTITPEFKEAEGQGEIILLVEDEEALRESVSTYLDLHGYKVLEASNGAQAVHIASQHAGSLDVLITDIILPKLSGVEIAREVARTSPQAVTLFMSGYTDRDLIDYDPATSSAEFLQKPFALQTLLQKLREMLGKRE
jgi:two-component system, cell cycle sensor histidine kinase and response regulator CckA